MRDSAWNTPFGRLLIVASVVSAIGGCVYASSLVKDEQNASVAAANSDDNLTAADMNATDMNSSDAYAVAGPPQDQPDEGPYMNATDMNAPDMNATDMNETDAE